MTRRTLALAACVLFGVLVLLGGVGAPVAAAPASVTIESRSPELKEKDGGGWTTSLAFTNLTAADEITLSVTATGCEPTFDKSAKLPAAERTKVTVTIPATCKVGKEGFAFTVTATAGGADVGTFRVTAGPRPKEDVDWSPLVVFPALLVGLSVVGLFLYPLWDPLAKPSDERWSYANLRSPLPTLGDKWSFKDSWVSTVTAAAALLTGIFASSDVLDVLTDDADAAAALATVGVVIAAAFVAAGGIVVAATTSATNDKKLPIITVGGFITGAVLTMTGAIGELWMVYESAIHLELDGWESWIKGGLVAAIALLALYALRTVPGVIVQGGKPASITGLPTTGGRFVAMSQAEAVKSAADPATPRRAALL